MDLFQNIKLISFQNLRMKNTQGLNLHSGERLSPRVDIENAKRFPLQYGFFSFWLDLNERKVFHLIHVDQC